MSTRKPRLPKYRPKPLGTGDEFLDRVSMTGVKPFTVATDGIEPEITIVQTGRSASRRPHDLYSKPDLISTLLTPGIQLIPKGKKWCSVKDHWVDLDGFSPDKRSRDGLHVHCKECRAAHARRMYWLKKEAIIAVAA